MGVANLTKPCIRGHSSGRYESGNCIDCHKESGRKHREAHKTHVRDVARRSAWKKQRMPSPTRPRPGHCELCKGPPTPGKRLCLDHDYSTAAFRGWLCGKCNTGLGLLGDNTEGLARALEYLHRARKVK